MKRKDAWEVKMERNQKTEERNKKLFHNAAQNFESIKALGKKENEKTFNQKVREAIRNNQMLREETAIVCLYWAEKAIPKLEKNARLMARNGYLERAEMISRNCIYLKQAVEKCDEDKLLSYFGF